MEENKYDYTPEEGYDYENEENEVVSVINLSKKWRTASYEERKAVCNILIHKILVNETGDCEVIWNI